MRLNFIKRSVPKPCLFAVALSLVISLPAVAQYSAPPNQANTFKDTSMVKPPAGAKVAIYKFEDLECPACARAYPIVHAAIERYKIPLVRHDFPLKMHVWSFDAAVTARYLQDKVSPKIAEDFRRDVFANQMSLASKDDLEAFTRRWFASHGQNIPFVMDPSGLFTQEVKSDFTLGERIGLTQTPTIFVVTNKEWTQVMDPTLLYQTIDAALAETGGPAKVADKGAHR
jgi:protein-disulfide isomerase